MVIKKFNRSESAQKFMQVRIGELCMCTNFSGRDLSGFGDTVTLKNGQISLSNHGLVHGQQVGQERQSARL